jgi:uncharacterized protein
MRLIGRRLLPALEVDLGKKMVLLSGPRQCGKTTLALSLVKKHGGAYYAWDDPRARRKILHFAPELDRQLWAFDELHKYRRWRGFLKGLFDAYHPEGKRILVTGSARLELYGRGGDSLQGRYFGHHLHPFTLSEILGLGAIELDSIPRLDARAPKGAEAALHALLRFGGFPEPFLSSSETEARRWRLGYGERLVQEEVRALEQVQEIERLELLFERLSDVAGSILSINSLREDLEVSFATVKKWITILERLDAVFRIPPFGPAKIKSVKKEQKIYFWDWARASSEAARFENLLAVHLLRLVHWIEDLHGERAELRYFRNRLGHEVDFVLLRRGKPWMAIEAKLSDGPLAAGLRYLIERVDIPFAFQVFLHGAEGRHERGGPKAAIAVPAARFLANLP